MRTGDGREEDLDGQLLVGELLASLDVVVWVADPEASVIRLVDERAAALIGHTLETWRTPRFWEQHLHPDERATVLEQMRQVIADGRERACVHRFIDAQGESRWFRTMLRSRPATANRPQELVGIMLEVTERIGAERVLGATEQRFKLFFEQIPAIVYTIDRELRFTSGIGAGLQPLGLRSGDTLTGISLYEYFHTNDPTHPAIVANRRAVEGAKVDFEIGWAGRTFQNHVEPFRDEAGAIIGAIGVALDITERKRLELERDRLLVEERAARAAAEEAVRLRDDFVSIASHELCTPVTSLLLTVQRAVRDGRADPTAVDKFLGVADRQTRRLHRLVRELLDVSRIRAGRWTVLREELDLTALVREVVARAADELGRSQSALAVCAPDEPVIGRWDGSALDQVASNLISNAIKFGAGKPIEVRIERVPDGVRLRVVDQGIGIEPARLPFIFDRFERAVSPREFSGLGLGLFIAREIIDAHGGTLRADSVPGIGSTFTVELPF